MCAYVCVRVYMWVCVYVFYRENNNNNTNEMKWFYLLQKNLVNVSQELQHIL